MQLARGFLLQGRGGERRRGVALDRLGLDILDREGAVSRPVCEAMARAAKKTFSATYGISVTGIAGPDGGNDGKPVGLVYLAIAGPGKDSIYVEKKVFPGERDLVRAQAATRALDLLRRNLEAESSENGPS